MTLPLGSIADVEVEEGQAEIHRENLRPVATVTAQLSGRDLGSAMAEIQARLAKEVKLPPTTEIEYGGLYQIQRESFLGLTQVLLASILLIFVILVFEFRSLLASDRDPGRDHPVRLGGARWPFSSRARR